MASVAVGLSVNLPAGRVMRAWVEGAERVVWRSATGQLSAWDNRCPHRGMRLSHGFVRGESLACIYHGWHYGDEGRCHYIPAHPKMTPHKSIGTTPHTILEQHGVMWVLTEGETSVPPHTGKLSEDLQPVRTLTVACSSGKLLKYLADSEVSDENGTLLLANTYTSHPMLITYQSDSSEFALILLIQTVSETTSNIHMLCSSHWSTEGKIGLSRWGDSIRRAAEVEQQ